MPDIPQNPICIKGAEENTLSWNEVGGVTYYNLYWKKDKHPNCYFYNLDDWTQLASNGTVSLINETLRLDVDDGLDGHAYVYGKHSLSSGDWEITIDLANYVADAPGTSQALLFFMRIDSADENNRVYIHYSHRAIHQAWIGYAINGGSYTAGTLQDVGSTPSKLRVSKVGTNLLVYVYTGSWVLVDQQDFGVHAGTFTEVNLICLDTSSRGGYVDLDNLIITPSVKNSGTKISNIFGLTHNHESLDPEHVYCYEVTAEGSESEPSEEVYGIPEEGIDPPTEISVVVGIEKNTINFTANPEVEKTHIYWDTSPGVKKETGNKISDISSPHEHINLDPNEIYYYILVSEDNELEGAESAEYSGVPLFPIPDAPGSPIVVILESGDSENIITCDDSVGAVSYNLYWSTDPDLTIENGTKIEDITRPYSHKKLTKGKYYYIITAVNAQGESEASEIIEGKIYFDGKEFEHIAVMLRRTLQQYKG